MTNIVFHSAINQSSQFFVRAIKSLPEYEIEPGYYLTIDPEKPPKEGSLVLVDDEIIAWHGQDRVDSVVVYVGRER